MSEFEPTAGTPVLIRLPDDYSLEWLTVGRYANGWQFTRNGLLLWIERGELDQLVRPAPMKEPTEWGAKITDDDHDWMRISDYRTDDKRISDRRTDDKWAPWMSPSGGRRRWDEMRNPRPYVEPSP